MGNQTWPGHKIFSGVNFEEVFKKYPWTKKKQNGTKKNNSKKTVDCYRILSISIYVILFVETTTLNVLKN